MGVESVRQANIGNSLNTPWSGQSEEIRIELQPPEDPPRFEDLPEYSYGDQDIIKGEYQYESSPRFGGSETGEGTFQIRTDSGLVLLQTNDSRPRPKKIFRALDQVINDETSISKTFVPNQHQVWEFLEQADRYREVKVVTPDGLIQSANQVDVSLDDMKNQYTVEIAHLEFDFNGEPIPVRYRNDTLEIDTNNSDAREYVIQIFEIIMTS